MNRIWVWSTQHWLGLAIAAGGILLIAGAGWLGYRNNRARQEAGIVAPPTVVADRGEVVLSVSAPGLSISTNTQALSARVDGFVEAILVQPGEAVQAGQLLARLGDRQRFRAQASAARLAVLQDRSALEEAQANAPLASVQAQQALETAQAALNSLQQTAAEQASQAQLALAEAQAAFAAAQAARLAMDQPHTTDELVIEAAETDYLLAKKDYKQALDDYQQVAKKKQTDPERAAALNALVEAEQRMNAALALFNWYTGRYPEMDIAQADAELAVAQANLEKAQAERERLKDGVSPTEVALAEAALAGARRDWARASAGSEPATLEIARATLELAQSELEKAEADLESLDLRAPFAGIILEVLAQPGQIASPGTALFTLLDPRAMQVRATVVEEDLPLVRPGQPVDLYFDALPEAGVTGTLDRVVPRRDSDSQAIYPVYIDLNRVPEQLAAGMTVDASIEIAKKAGVLRLPRAVVRAHSDDTADVQVWANGRAEQRAITVGLRGDAFIEVTGGLVEGELVVAQ
jgi:RND family efflux transporter MFP subunit